MFEREYRDLAHVPRWGITPTIKTQSVAEHSYYVTLYADQICHKLGLDDGQRGRVLRYALNHDRSESYMSDIPGPIKRAISNKEDVDKFEKSEDAKRFEMDIAVGGVVKAIISLADMMDEVSYWKKEESLGNQFAKTIEPELMRRLIDKAVKLGNLTNQNVRLEIVRPFLEALSVPKLIPTFEEKQDVAS